MALTKTDVSALYVAIFNRASEGEGNTFWQTQGTTAEVASAMLDTAPAKEYFGAALDDDQAFIEHIYLNTLGKTLADDAEGIEFWTGELATQSRGEVIARLIESALDAATAGPAQDKFKNMIAVSDFAADTLEDAPADLGVLRFDAGLQGVTADPATVEAVKAKVEQVLNPVDPVTAALGTLAAANKAEADFLQEAKVTLKQAENSTDAQIKAAIAGAVAAAEADLIDGDIVVDNNTVEFGAVYAGSDSAAVKAAKVGDKRAELTEELADAQEKLDEATAEVVKIAGLPAALLNLEAASKAEEAALAAIAPANTKVEAEIEKLNKLYPAADFNDAVDTTATPAKLNAEFTEAKYPGVTELLNLTQAHQAAVATHASAQLALYQANASVVWLDAADGAKDAMGTLIDSVKFADGADKLTLKEVQAELDKRLAADQETAGDNVIKLDAYGFVAPDSEAAAPTYMQLQGLLFGFQSDDANHGEVSKTIVAERAEVESAQAVLDAFELALTKQASANALAQELKEKGEAIDAAEEAFEELGVAAPKSVDGAVVSTIENDLFTLSDNGGSILNFGLQGEDRIYVGSDDDFQLVVLGATQDITKQSLGERSDMEIFVQQKGLDTEVWVEKQAFAGNASSQSDLVKITLAGVSADDLVLEDGFLSIA